MSKQRDEFCQAVFRAVACKRCGSAAGVKCRTGTGGIAAHCHAIRYKDEFVTRGKRS